MDGCIGVENVIRCDQGGKEVGEECGKEIGEEYGKGGRGGGWRGWEGEDVKVRGRMSIKRWIAGGDAKVDEVELLVGYRFN